MSPNNRCVNLMFLLSLFVFAESRALALSPDAKRARVETKRPADPYAGDSKISVLPRSVVAQSMSYLNLQELLDVALVSSSMKAAASLTEQTALALESNGKLPKIDYAKKFPRLKRFRIRRAKLDADALNRLAAIKTLTELELNEVRFSKTGINHLDLQPFPELLVFRVSNWETGSTKLPNLNSGVVFPKLKKFIIQGLEDTDNFRDLVENPGTRETLEEVVVNVKFYDSVRSSPQLGKLKNLRVLKLANMNDAFVELPTLGLGALSSLTHLQLGGLVLAGEDLIQLSRLENFTELSVITPNASALDATGAFKRLTSLTWESLEAGEINPKISMGEKFPALKSLEIKRARMNSFAASFPSGLENFHFFTARPDRLSDLKMIPELKNLGVACASPRRTLPDSFGQLFPKLRALSLSHCPVANLVPLSLSGLTELRLVTDTPKEDFRGMRPFPNLEALSISSEVLIPLTTVSLENYFPNLKHLTLENVRMEFSHLAESAAGLKNSLETLEVLDSTLTGKVNLQFGQLTKLQRFNLLGTIASSPDPNAVLEQLQHWTGMIKLKEVHLGNIYNGTIEPITVFSQEGLKIEYDIAFE